MELFSIRIQRTFQLVSTQNITKAILKNTISKEVQLIGKTYMDYKSQMK